MRNHKKKRIQHKKESSTNQNMEETTIMKYKQTYVQAGHSSDQNNYDSSEFYSEKQIENNDIFLFQVIP